MGAFRSLAGQKFGRLTVLANHESRLNRTGKSKELFWLCRCDCGKEVYVRADSLRRGMTRSCGCLNDEERRKTKIRQSRFPVVHNPNTNRLYRIFNLMHYRCRNTHLKAYGGKGIKVCDEWNTYEPFHEWAMANGYADGLSIDRIDNNKGYSPDNCRWADRMTQMNNTTKNHPVTYHGVTKNIGQWAKELGIDRKVLSYRINHGWSVEDAFNIRPSLNNRKGHGKKGVI